MKLWKHLSPGLLVLAASMACRPADDGRETVAAAARDIPVTTSSPEALTAFREGQKAKDVGRDQEANALFENAVRLDPSFAYAYLNVAATAASAREFATNLELARAHLEGKSDGERILVEINQTFFDNDSEKRLELARSLVGRYPEGPRAWVVLAGMQGGQNQHEAARESLDRALELDPDFLAAHFAVWGSYLFSEPKDFARAEKAMWRCLEIDPEEAKPYENLGDVYRAMQDLERARELYSRAVEKDPSLKAASIKKGHINSFLGRFEEARADYDAGLAGTEGQTRVTYANYRAFVHLHAGDPRAALDELDGLLDLADTLEMPEDQRFGAKIFTLTNQATIALHHNLLADAERIVGRLAMVMRANSESVGDPEFTRHQEANILLWQGQLAARKGDSVIARAKAEEHRSLLEDDRNPRRFEGYHGLLGLIELLRGDAPAAVEQFERADLSVMYVKYHLALAEEAAGHAEQAKALFREVAQWNFNSVGFALVRKDALERI